MDKSEVKQGLKNAKKARKIARRSASRNSHLAAWRYAVAALAFSWILLSGVLEARSTAGDAAAALPWAVLAFFVVWVVLGVVERKLSAAIAKDILERRAQERAEAERARAEAERATEAADKATR